MPKNSKDYYKNYSTARTKSPEEQEAIERKNGFVLGSERGEKLANQSEVSQKWNGGKNENQQSRQPSNKTTKNDSSKTASEREKYNKLQQSRIKDQRTAMKSTSSKSVVTTSSKGGSTRRGRGKRRKRKPQINQDMAYAAATAYKEISPSEDAAHIIAIVISLGADIGTLVPVLNWVVAPLAIMTLWVVYFLGGHWQKRIGRKAVVSAMGYSIEMIPVASALPAFTITAVMNYSMALIEKRLIKMQNNEV